MAAIEHVFLDRDGTIIQDKHYLCEPDKVELLPGASQALTRLAEHGCRLYLVSNQSGIGRGYFDEQACLLCQDKLAEILRGHGVSFVDMAYCPHAPEAGCDCRKPGLGLWKQMAALYDLAPHKCAMIGDKREDAAFGRNAGFAASVMVLTGHGKEHAKALGLPELAQDQNLLPLETANPGHWPHALARDLPAAVAYLLSL